MAKKKLSIEDIFNDKDFEQLLPKEKKSVIKTDDDRLIDAFQEINIFFDKYNREPSRNLSELKLSGNLKTIRGDEKKKIILKTYDKHNLLGHVEMPKPTLDDIFQDDDLGLLDTDNDLSIYKFKHTPKPEDRAETDFVAQRKPLKEKEFKRYEAMFHKVHKEIKEGKRKLKPFKNIEKNLHVGDFYVMDGILLYLESADLKREEWEQKSGNRVRIEGRTRTIFENGTYSNMLYRSLGKQIQKNGKLVTNTEKSIENELFKNANVVEKNVDTGWIYVLKSKSKNSKIAKIKNLYKIGYSKTDVKERVSNASKEATYLFADVHIVSTHRTQNLNINVLENLLHRFFADTCLNVDIETPEGHRITPREWFVVPFAVIEQVLKLIENGNILHYKYDAEIQKIVLK